MNRQSVSVVVPVYNGARRLGAAIDSILSQERQPREIIVVDDGSTDETPAVIAGYGDRLIAHRQDNLGPAGARNTGLAQATTPFLAFLDADDLWLPTTLADQLHCLAANPNAGAVWGLTERIVAPGVTAELDDWHGRPQWTMALGSIVFRRSLIEAVGGFDPTLRCGEDLDLMVRLAERRIPVPKHPAVVHIRQIHGENYFSLDEATMREGHFGAVAKAIARRRSRQRSVEAS